MKKLLFVFGTLMSLLSCKRQEAPVALSKTLDFKKAESFLYQQNDSAFYYFNKVVTSSKDSLQIATAYNYMASIQSDAGDYFGAQESLSLSLKLLNERLAKNRYCLASDYNELGMTSSNLRNYDNAISFFDLALKFSDNPNSKLIFLNNKANAYRKKQAYPEALALYQRVLSETNGEGKEYARILTNMAITKWLNQARYNPVPELKKALQIRQKSNDLWGKNSSYAHLSDYYGTSKPDSALFYATEMYAVARKLNSPDDQLEALQKLIKLSPFGDFKQYFTRYQLLNDSLQTARNAAKNQFALIRYDAEKNKVDNLRLQKDNAEKKYQIIRQRGLLYGIVSLLIGGSVFALFWYRKRKQRLELEAQQAISEHQFRTSKKVHDVVANGLYRIMSEIEHRDAVNREQLLDQIEVLYEQSRDISYEKQPLAEDDFHEQLTRMLTTFSKADTKIGVVGNDPEIWESVDGPVRNEIRHILQELMVNMAKHSRASHVVVRFTREGDRVEIHYTDDGVGFPANVIQGNGLRNTGNRIDRIHGSITFDTHGEKGLQITVSFSAA